MIKCVPMEQALIGAVRGIKERIEKAISENEKWHYQLGPCPRYVGHCTVVDDEEPNADFTILTFCWSPWDIYEYRIRVEFHDVGGMLDVMIFDINTTDSRFNVFPDYSFTAQALDEIVPCEVSEENFIFYPVDDIGTVLSALSYIVCGELEMDKIMASRKEEEARKNERILQRARFTVIDGSKGQK